MKKMTNVSRLVPLAGALLCATFVAALATSEAEGQTSRWVSAYYAGYTGHSPADIDYSAVTHVIHFAVVPNADGTLRTGVNDILQTRAEIISRTHAAGKKVIMCVGGAETDDRFEEAVDNHIEFFIDNLIDTMTFHGYDGIDIDWEPLTEGSPTPEDPDPDGVRYPAFITALRESLNQRNPSLVLTVALDFGRGSPGGNIFAPINQHFDQINLKVRAVSDSWQAWASLHNVTSVSVPTVDAIVERFVYAGVPQSKLGIDIPPSGSNVKSDAVSTAPFMIFTAHQQ